MDGTAPRPEHERAPRPPFWPLTRRRRGRTEALAAELVAGSWALPVFGFAEWARLFVRLGPLEEVRWRGEKIGARVWPLCCSAP